MRKETPVWTGEHPPPLPPVSLKSYSIALANKTTPVAYSNWAATAFRALGPGRVPGAISMTPAPKRLQSLRS